MFCKECVKHKNKGTKGCQNFPIDNVKKHSTSNEHMAAIKCSSMATAGSNVTRLWDRQLSQEEEVVQAAMKNVYWLAKEELATIKYVSLINLVNYKDVKAFRTEV